MKSFSIITVVSIVFLWAVYKFKSTEIQVDKTPLYEYTPLNEICLVCHSEKLKFTEFAD